MIKGLNNLRNVESSVLNSKMIWLSLVWLPLFNSISVCEVYLMPTPLMLKDRSWRGKEDHTFPKGVNPKVDAIEQLEFELAAQYFSHYVTGTPLSRMNMWDYIKNL